MEDKIKLIENLFHQLEQEIITFNKNINIHCVSGCGKCCTHPTIEASPLEFLPWAFHLFLNEQAEKTLDALNENQLPTCYLFKPTDFIGNGSCGDYKYRGLICRLFGSAANTNKYGNLRLVTCKLIKESQSENYEITKKLIDNGLNIPVFTNYYMQLNQIDFHLANQIVPINKALKIAIEEVLQYYAYRPFPNPLEKIA